MLSRTKSGLLTLSDLLTRQRQICMDREKDIFFRPSNLNPGHFHVDLLERKAHITFLQQNCLDGLLQGEFLTVVLSEQVTLQPPLC